MYAKYRDKKRVLKVKRIYTAEPQYDFDLLIVGCGAGGMRAAKEAAVLGQRVAVVDFATPSPRGTTWGCGGTCVNVGCIPDKLMHYAAMTGEGLKVAKAYGWDVKNTKHDWVQLKTNLHNYVLYLNAKFEKQLEQLNVKYIKAFGEFTGTPHEIKATDKHGKVTMMTSRYIIIAVGSRPRYPDMPGVKEYTVTSDDLFTMAYSPGKSLVIGASFVSLEIAGFLASLGLDVTVLVRSILLRGYDQQMSEIVARYMANIAGVKFIRPAILNSIEKLSDGSPGWYRVRMTHNGQQIEEDYNTIIVAIGRDPATKTIGCEKVGVQLTRDGYVVHTDEQTTCPYVYAVGDILEDRPEMAPTAAQAGKLLVRRIFANATEKMYYENVPAAVFTPLEYGFVGLSEEEAEKRYGADDLEVYHSYFQPLEWALPDHEENVCYAKLICLRSQKERVVGFHMAGPNAAEISQGFALALNLNATKADFDKCVGIHPTCAEVVTLLEISKRSGLTQRKVGAEVKPCFTGIQPEVGDKPRCQHVQEVDDEQWEQVKVIY